MPPFAKSFDIVQMEIIKRFRDPAWKIKRFFNYGDREQSIKKHCKVVNDVAYAIVSKRRQELREAAEDPEVSGQAAKKGRESKDMLSL